MTLFIYKIQCALFLATADAFVELKLLLKWCHVSLLASLGGCRVGWGIDSTVIGMCVDGCALEEVESMEQTMFFSTHRLFFHMPV